MQKHGAPTRLAWKVSELRGIHSLTQVPAHGLCRSTRLAWKVSALQGIHSLTLFDEVPAHGLQEHGAHHRVQGERGQQQGGGARAVLAHGQADEQGHEHGAQPRHRHREPHGHAAPLVKVRVDGVPEGRHRQPGPHRYKTYT